MKNILLIGGLIVLIVAGYMIIRTNETPMSEENNMTDTMDNADISINEAKGEVPEIFPISHASFIMNWSGTIIYNDPVGEVEAYDGQTAPDIVLLSDIHGDHLNVETLSTLVNEATIYAPQAVYELLPDSLQEKTVVMKNDETLTFGEFSLTALPMYNYEEQGLEIRHEKGRGNGYLLENDGVRVYIAGDTGGTPEMKALTDIDIAFIPMNLPYTMGVEEAAEAVIAFSPKQVIPYHYRGPDGLSDVDKFKELVVAGNPSIEVSLLDWYGE